MQKLDITFRVSKQFVGLLIFLYLGGACLLMKMLPAKISWITVFIFSGYASYIIWQDGLLKGKNALSGMYHSFSEWYIIIQNKVETAIILGESTVTPWISILRFRIPGRKRKYTHVLFPDSLEPEVYRQLRRILKCEKDTK